MRHDVKTQGSTRHGWWTAVIAGVAVLGAATGAEAGEGHWKKKKHRHYFAPPGHVYYMAPAPGYYYRPPPPVVVYPEPVYMPRYRYYREPSINVTIPLR